LEPVDQVRSAAFAPQRRVAVISLIGLTVLTPDWRLDWRDGRLRLVADDSRLMTDDRRLFTFDDD
jgi:hypothetical protein